jgi:hypothetical protein
MEIFFEKIKQKENAEFQKNEKKWWNGRAYLPFFDYYLKYNYLNSLVKIHYEFRQSEFSKPSAIDGGAFGDRHICNVKCIIKVKESHPSFSITELSLFSRLFRKQNEINYKVNCIDNKMRKILEHNKILHEIFLIVKNSPEFSPLIEGKMNGNIYELNITYNTQQKDSNALNSVNEFCKSLIESIN